MTFSLTVLGRECEAERDELTRLQQVLLQEQLNLQNRNEYDRTAQSILSLPSQNDLHQYFQENPVFYLPSYLSFLFRSIALVTDQIASVQETIQAADSRLDHHYEECRAILSTVHELLDVVNSDIRTLPE